MPSPVQLHSTWKEYKIHLWLEKVSSFKAALSYPGCSGFSNISEIMRFQTTQRQAAGLLLSAAVKVLNFWKQILMELAIGRILPTGLINASPMTILKIVSCQPGFPTQYVLNKNCLFYLQVTINYKICITLLNLYCWDWCGQNKLFMPHGHKWFMQAHLYPSPCIASSMLTFLREYLR